MPQLFCISLNILYILINSLIFFVTYIKIKYFKIMTKLRKIYILVMNDILSILNEIHYSVLLCIQYNHELRHIDIKFIHNL